MRSECLLFGIQYARIVLYNCNLSFGPTGAKPGDGGCSTSLFLEETTGWGPPKCFKPGGPLAWLLGSCTLCTQGLSVCCPCWYSRRQHMTYAQRLHLFIDTHMHIHERDECRSPRCTLHLQIQQNSKLVRMYYPHWGQARYICFRNLSAGVVSISVLLTYTPTWLSNPRSLQEARTLPLPFPRCQAFGIKLLITSSLH